MFPDGNNLAMSNQEPTSEMIWPGAIAAITLFVEDLENAKRFYQDVFDLPVFFEDDSSAVFRFGETLVNLLRASEAPGLIAPALVAAPTPPASSSRSASRTSTRPASASGTGRGAAERAHG